MWSKNILRIFAILVISLGLSGFIGNHAITTKQANWSAIDISYAALQSRYVSDVIVKTGTGCDTGYDYIPVDLNEGSGGEYVSLCVQYNGSSTIRGLTLVKKESKSKNPDYSCPSGYSKAGVDLNAGITKSKWGIDRPVTHLFLCKTSNGSGSIKNITVFSNRNNKDIIKMPLGYKTLDSENTDLNESVSGNFIHMYYITQIEDPIIDLDVTLSDGAIINPPSGYTQITVDLNEGSGGKFIYLNYKKGGTQSPITNLKIIDGKDATCPTPTAKDSKSLGWYKIDKDLNKNSGGAYLYLCTFRSKEDAPIVDIRIYSVSKDYSNLLKTPPYGYTSTNVDLNKGAKGRYINLYFLRQYK
jgi:hypothetical protein